LTWSPSLRALADGQWPLRVPPCPFPPPEP
jgi:hypothetical protein